MIVCRCMNFFIGPALAAIGRSVAIAEFRHRALGHGVAFLASVVPPDCTECFGVLPGLAARGVRSNPDALRPLGQVRGRELGMS